MPLTKSHADLPGRLVALAVFLIGIAALVFVFVTALHLFQAPVQGLQLPVKPGSPPPPAASIGAALAVFVRQLLLLALMVLAGSLIASKGVQLYFSAPHYGADQEPASSSNPAKNGHAALPGTAAITPGPTEKTVQEPPVK